MSTPPSNTPELSSDSKVPVSTPPVAPPATTAIAAAELHTPIDPAPQYDEGLPTYGDAMSSANSNAEEPSYDASRAPDHIKTNQDGGIERAQSGSDAAAFAPRPALGKPTIGERFHRFSSKAGKPLNVAANIVGSEGWWPSSVEQECLKAARILHSFSKLTVPQPSKSRGPMHPTGLTRRSMVKIPPEVLRNCAGLAIFNVLRAGAWHGSLSAGSGVVIARRHDGTWSPPSSFVVSTIGAGIMAGLEMYDTVCVLNTPAQVDSFTNPRFSLGGGLSVAVGPVGSGAAVNAAVHRDARPIWSYMKSRGLFVGLQIDGTAIVSRGDANAVFYGERGITAKKILLGDVAWPMAAKPLFEVLKAIDGRRDIDAELVRDVVDAPPPGDRVLDEKAVAAAAAAAENRTDEDSRENVDRESDIYDNSVMDEKERLAKSGF